MEHPQGAAAIAFESPFYGRIWTADREQHLIRNQVKCAGRIAGFRTGDEGGGGTTKKNKKRRKERATGGKGAPSDIFRNLEGLD